MGAIESISWITSGGMCPTHLESAAVLTGLFTWSVDNSLLQIEKVKKSNSNNDEMRNCNDKLFA